MIDRFRTQNATFDSDAPHRVKVDAATIILARKNDASAASENVDFNAPGSGFASLDPLGLCLDAMSYRITDDLDQSSLHSLDHMTIEANVPPLDFETHLLAERPGGIPRRALEGHEDAARGHKPKP